MQMTLLSLLESLLDAECAVSVHRGLMTTPDGHTLDINQAIQGLQRQCSGSQHDFVEQIANLRIWGYDQDDGSTYLECPEPSDGYLDSHCCLMGLIEQARALHAPRETPRSSDFGRAKQGEGAK